MNKNKFAFVTALLLLQSTATANLITNGGFEDDQSQFVNSGSNYMFLTPGDTALTGWDIDEEFVWGVNPTDGFSASSGDGFVDLSGFGRRSGGAISQAVATTVGATYLLSVDLWSTRTSVSLNGVTVVDSPVSSGWTTFTAAYTATASVTDVSVFIAASDFSVIEFVDNVSFTLQGGPSTSVPAPAGLLLLGAGLAGIAMVRRREKA